MSIRTSLLVALVLATPVAAAHALPSVPSSVQLETGPMSAGWLMTVEGGAASDEIVAERYYWFIIDTHVSQLDALAFAYGGACLGCLP